MLSRLKDIGAAKRSRPADEMTAERDLADILIGIDLANASTDIETIETGNRDGGQPSERKGLEEIAHPSWLAPPIPKDVELIEQGMTAHQPMKRDRDVDPQTERKEVEGIGHQSDHTHLNHGDIEMNAVTEIVVIAVAERD